MIITILLVLYFFVFVDIVHFTSLQLKNNWKMLRFSIANVCTYSYDQHYWHTIIVESYTYSYNMWELLGGQTAVKQAFRQAVRNLVKQSDGQLSKRFLDIDFVACELFIAIIVVKCWYCYCCCFTCLLAQIDWIYLLALKSPQSALKFSLLQHYNI